MSEAPLVTVVIPHFNGPAILERCLTALQASTYPAMEILLVDNASHDGSAVAAAERFASLLADVTSRIFDVYGDDTVVHPGHGKPTTLGAERPHLQEWRERGW